MLTLDEICNKTPEEIHYILSDKNNLISQLEADKNNLVNQLKADKNNLINQHEHEIDQLRWRINPVGDAK